MHQFLYLLISEFGSLSSPYDSKLAQEQGFLSIANISIMYFVQDLTRTLTKP